MAENLKVLRVMETCHQMAKVNAARNGMKLQVYLERLIVADEQKLIKWEKFKPLGGKGNNEKL